MKTKITKFQIFLIVITLFYIVLFGFLYLSKKNYEFIAYVGVLIFFFLFISRLHLKFNFPTGVLVGLSIWGFMHMSGGYFIIDGSVLYAYWIIPGLLKFDQFVHAFGFGFATLLSYYIIKPNLRKDYSKKSLYIFLVFIGMGLGALNEIVEFLAVLSIPETGVGGYNNTMFDIIFNTVGAIIAVTYIYFKEKNI